MAIQIKTPSNDSYSNGYYDEPEIRKYKPSVNLNDPDVYYTRPNVGPISARKGLDIAYISNIVLHGLMALSILINLYIAFFKPESFAGGLKTFETLMVIAIIADAIIYNIFVEKNILLIVFAVLLSGLYPVAKGKIVDNEISTVSLLLWIGYMVSILIVFCSMLM